MRVGERSDWRRQGLILLGVCLGAAILRSIGLSERPLWLDEAFSVLYAQLDVETFVRLRHSGTNPPLYHLLLKGWVGLFGTSETGLRSLSVVAGSAAVGAVYLTGRAIGGTRCGLVAAALLAVNNMAVGSSQEARYYALTGLLAIVSAGLLREAVQRRRTALWIGYAAAMIVFVWVHTYAWFVLAAHVATVGVAAIRMRREDRARRRMLIPFGLATIAALAAFRPWAGVLAHQVGAVLDGFWIDQPSPGVLFVMANAFVAPLAEWQWPLTGGLAMAAAVGLRRARTPSTPLRRPPVPHFDITLLFAWMVLPVAIPLTWSLVATPIFQVRYAMLAQPAALLLAAWAIARRPRSGLLALAFVVAIARPAGDRGQVVEDWRQAAEEIRGQTTAEIPVYICEDYTYYALRYYLDETRHPITPFLRPDAGPAEFASIYPRPALAYNAWLTELAAQDAGVAIVLAHVRYAGDGTGRERILTDLRARGAVTSVPLRGDVELFFWKPNNGAPNAGH